MTAGDEPGEPGMVRTETTLADGRYVIFYTFEDEPATGDE